MKVWVVTKTCGEYSDRNWDVDSVWTTAEAAERRCGEVTGKKAYGTGWETWEAEAQEMDLDAVTR